MTTNQNPQRADRIIARCRQLAACTEVPGETTRTFLSPPMHEVHTLLRQWMEAAGMTVHIDAIGNLRGLYPGLTPNAPRLIIASHLDTVPNAGAFDGILGVVLGVAIVEELHGQHLPFAIEVIGFSEEEGVRFSKPFLGSLALIGKLDAETLARTDTNGISLTEAIRNFGLNPDELPARNTSHETFAYLEFHIEQGPVLESESQLTRHSRRHRRPNPLCNSPSPARPTTPEQPPCICATTRWPPPPNGSSAVETYANYTHRTRSNRRQTRSLPQRRQRHRRHSHSIARRPPRQRQHPQQPR